MSNQLGKYLTFINLSEKKLKLAIHSNVRTLLVTDLTVSSAQSLSNRRESATNQANGTVVSVTSAKHETCNVNEKYSYSNRDTELIKNKKYTKPNIEIPISSNQCCSIFEIIELNGEEKTAEKPLLDNVPFFQPYTFYGTDNNNELTSFGETIKKTHTVMIENYMPIKVTLLSFNQNIHNNSEIKCLTNANNMAVLNGASQIHLQMELQGATTTGQTQHTQTSARSSVSTSLSVDEQSNNTEDINVEKRLTIISVRNDLCLTYKFTELDLNPKSKNWDFLKYSVKRKVRFLNQNEVDTINGNLMKSIKMSKWIIIKVPQSSNNSNTIRDGEDVFILLDTTEKYLQVDRYGNVICEKLNKDLDSNAKWKIRIFRN